MSVSFQAPGPSSCLSFQFGYRPYDKIRRDSFTICAGPVKPVFKNISRLPGEHPHTSVLIPFPYHLVCSFSGTDGCVGTVYRMRSKTGCQFGYPMAFTNVLGPDLLVCVSSIYSSTVKTIVPTELITGELPTEFPLGRPA
jgi:hypothetical protein